MKFFEDMQVGDRYEVGSHTFTAEGIKSFASRFDPQPFHVDEAAAADSHFGALCASGWHTVCVWMSLTVAYRKRVAAGMASRGDPVGGIGPSPGVTDLKWLKPVFVGDTVVYTTEVTAMRRSASKPMFGLVTMRNTGVNQHGDPVLTFTSNSFVSCRDRA